MLTSTTAMLDPETAPLTDLNRELAPSPALLDPDTARVDEISRELVRLQRRFGVASHEVGERGLRPEGIDDATLAWWVAAHRAIWRRRFETTQTVTSKPVEQVELRKTRLRKPPAR